MRFYLIILLLFASLHASNPSPSDTLATTPRDRRFELEELRVIGTSPTETSSRVNVIHLEDTKRSDELNLTGLMQNIPGVNITAGSRGESSLRIRGASRQNVRIMVDGRQVNAGYFGNVDLSEIPVFDIEEIHIIKGVVSSLYGANSSGGVVNFVTRQPDNSSWLTMRTMLQRNNTQSLQMTTSRRFDLWDYWLSLTGYRTDGFILSQDFVPTAHQSGGVRNQTKNSSVDIQSRVNVSFLDINSFGLSFGYTFSDERNLPSSIYEARYRKFIDWKRAHISGLANIYLSPFLKIQPNVYYDRYDNTYIEASDPDFTNIFLDSIIKSWTVGSQIRSEFILSEKNKFYQLYRFESQAYNRKDDGFYSDWTSNSTILNNASLMLRHKLNNHWQASISYGTSQSQRNFKDYTPDAQRETIRTDWHHEYSFALNFDDKTSNFLLAMSRNIQYPTLRNLYSSSRGNVWLKPEISLKTEASYGRNFIHNAGFSKIETTVFLNLLNDMIDRRFARYTNHDKNLRNAGVEVAILNRFFDKIDTEHSVCYINLHMNEGFNFIEIPEWSVTNALNLDITQRLRFSYSVNWNDWAYGVRPNGRLATLPAHTLHNAGLRYKRSNYRIGFSVTNLFDLDYQQEYGYPSAGRNYSLSLEWSVF